MNIFIAIVGLSLLVLVHEAGHFFTAGLFAHCALADELKFAPTSLVYVAENSRDGDRRNVYG